MFRKYFVHWLHIKSGETGRRPTTAEYPSEAAFLVDVNRWNRDPRWKYWATVADLTEVPQ